MRFSHAVVTIIACLSSALLAITAPTSFTSHTIDPTTSIATVPPHHPLPLSPSLNNHAPWVQESQSDLVRSHSYPPVSGVPKRPNFDFDISEAFTSLDLGIPDGHRQKSRPDSPRLDRIQTPSSPPNSRKLSPVPLTLPIPFISPLTSTTIIEESESPTGTPSPMSVDSRSHRGGSPMSVDLSSPAPPSYHRPQLKRKAHSDFEENTRRKKARSRSPQEPGAKLGFSTSDL